MKKVICLLLTLTMLCGIAASAFAEETSDPIAQEQKPELVGAEIVFIPIKNLIVFGNGVPNTPEGIVLLLKYDNGDREFKIITYRDDLFMAGNYYVKQYSWIDIYRVGVLTNKICIDNKFELKYVFLALPTF